MKNDRRNAWTRHTHNDTFFNGALIAAGIVGLLLATLNGPLPELPRPSASLLVSGIVLSEGIRG
jgi:hypothetical protein